VTEPIRVLIVDDDAAFRFAMAKALTRRGFKVSEADSGEAALTVLELNAPPVALLDLRMRGIDGLDVLRRARSLHTRFIVLTGHGSVAAAVDAMKLGAFSFLEKPVDADTLAPLIEQAAQDGTTPQRVQTGFAPPIVGVSAACDQRELFESELFGHRKGAFTGAANNRDGLFIEAEGGTLFIDEVAELPLDCQAKFLRALETRRIRPLGASREQDSDVRIIAATNRDLWGEVKAGNFREDLFFRLQVLPIVLPPLRDRQEDVLPLTQHLLGRIGAQNSVVNGDAELAMIGYTWPGNVRELLNVLRRSVLFADGPAIDGALMRRMLAASVFGHAERPNSEALRDSRNWGSAAQHAPSTPAALGTLGSSSLADLERAHIEDVLTRCDGNVTRAAAALGIDRRTLQRKLKGLRALPR